jgi:hypothetical protein
MNSLPPTQEELDNASWFKSTRSQSANGCVEVAHVNDDWTAVRDSKNLSGSAHLFTSFEWECFIDGAKRGEFDRA